MTKIRAGLYLRGVHAFSFCHRGAIGSNDNATSGMIRDRAIVGGAVGLHARPAAELVRTAERFRSRIRLAKDGVWVNGKSILAILTLAAERGSEIEIEADGVDEQEALAALKSKVEDLES